MRTLILAMVIAVPTIAHAQVEKRDVETIRPHRALRIRVVHKRPASGGDEAFVLVAADGTVDLDKVRPGYGQLKLSRKPPAEAETAIQDHLAKKEFNVAASVVLLTARNVEEELVKQRQWVKNLPKGVAHSRERIRDLERSMAETKTKGSFERPTRVAPHGALEISLRNVGTKYRRGITVLRLVSGDGWIDLDLGDEASGRFHIVGKSAAEAATTIREELRRKWPEAEVTIVLQSKFNIQGAITSLEQSIETSLGYLERCKQNVRELEQALPLD